MSDAGNLTRFRCPQCRSRSLIDTASETIPYLCPTCHVELEPIGKGVNPSAITAKVPASITQVITPREERTPAAEQPRMPAPQPVDNEYVQKIHFWVRLLTIVVSLVSIVIIGLLLSK